MKIATKKFRAEDFSARSTKRGRFIELFTNKGTRNVNIEGMSTKRPASSPADKIPENKKHPSETQEMLGMLSQKAQAQKQAQAASTSASKPNVLKTDGSLFKFEVLTINEKPFYGSLAEIEILHIWEKVLGRSKDDIFAMSYSRSLARNFRVTIKLNFQALSSDVYHEPTFEYHRDRPDDDTAFDVLQCRIINFSSVKPAEIGKLTRVTVRTNEFSVDPQEILPWLLKFGSVSTVGDFEKNSLGLRTDVFETEILLQKHIPEYLPIAGRKLQVYYPGIPKACNNCFEVGHLKRNCKAKKKRDWVERVAELRASGDFEEELFGGWIAILEQLK